LPALLNHWRVLIETSRLLGDRAAPLHAAPHPALPPHLPGVALSVWAYLGANGPDIPYLTGAPFRTTGKRWADLMHYKHTGSFPMRLLEGAAVLDNAATRSALLAYTLGYLTHIATDIAAHPYVNSVAGAYGHQPLARAFWPVGMHTYLELCMDEVTAQSYFGDHSARLWGALWHRYLPGDAQIDRAFIAWFSAAFAEVYTLDAGQQRAMAQAYRVGCHALRAFAGGHRLFRLAFARLRLGREHRLRLVDTKQMDACLHLAIRISVRLCARALDYYEVLRTGALPTAMEHTRAMLRADLRDWNLDTGMAPEATIVGNRVIIRYRHCWNHFSEQLEEIP
jgi:hypothetical protein